MTRGTNARIGPGVAGTDADAGLVRQLAEGDMDAASALYDVHAARVLGVAYRIVRDLGDAEDVVQEVFSQAWRSAQHYNASRGSVAAWLLMMARTRAIDRLRSRRARGDDRREPLADVADADGVSAPDRMIADADAARVRTALVDLPDEQRRALELAYYDGLTQSEIAAQLRAPLGTVKTRIRTALTTLRRSLRA